MRSRAARSRCASGSSRSSTSGSWTRHAASAASFRSPPERRWVGRSRSSSSRPSSSSSARARPSKPGPPAAVQRSTSSSWRRSTRAIRSRSPPSSPSCPATRTSSRSSSSRSGPRGAHQLDRRALVALDLLRQIGDDEPPPLRQLARVRHLETREDAHHRRLAAPVRADHAHARARLDVEIEALEDHPRAERLDDPAQLQEGHPPTLAPPRRPGDKSPRLSYRAQGIDQPGAS